MERFILKQMMIVYLMPSIGYFEESGFTILKKTYDLHVEPIWENNIETEHEKMFSEQGIKIKALIAKIKR